MADHAEQFLGAAYDVLMSNMSKVQGLIVLRLGFCNPTGLPSGPLVCLKTQASTCIALHCIAQGANWKTIQSNIGIAAGAGGRTGTLTDVARRLPALHAAGRLLHLLHPPQGGAWHAANPAIAIAIAVAIAIATAIAIASVLGERMVAQQMVHPDVRNHMCPQEQEPAKPAEPQQAAGAGGGASPKEKENRPDGYEQAADGKAGNEDAGSAGAPPAPQDASPFAAISASMGWDTFHLVRKLGL